MPFAEHMTKSLARAVQQANKYALSKKHECLYPGCAKTSSQCHSIQRAVCVEALAKDGHVYTLEPTFSSMIEQPSLIDATRVVRVGVNEAGKFDGFCGQHDYELFDRAETGTIASKRGMFIALHIRSAALEYCRKRRSADFLQKMAELAEDADSAAFHSAAASFYRNGSNRFRELHLDRVFGLIFGHTKETIDYFFLPFGRNLQVSACGMFNVTESFDSIIGFNLVSYSDFTMLLLTTFGSVSEYLDQFLIAYPFPQAVRQLVNDVAFRLCEEPLIAPVLWEQLDDTQRLKIRMNLLPPSERAIEVDNNVISVGFEDILDQSPAGLKKLFDRIYRRPGEVGFHSA